MINKTVDKLEATLERAINHRLSKDGKCGLYYSGGIDSSLISTFGNFEKLTYKDGDYQQEFIKIFPKIVKLIGKPIYSFSPFAWWKLGEMAVKKNIKTVISGEGADELFGGYIRYMPEALYYQACQEFPSYKDMFPWEMDITERGKKDFYGPLQELIEAEKKIAKHFGLIIRFPFLDHNVISFAWHLPPELKINNFETKVVLRRLLEKRDPSYQHVEKHGLFCSVNEWIGSTDGFNKTDYLNLQRRILYGKR